MWQEEKVKKVFRRIELFQNAMVQTQKALTALPAISPINKGIGEVKKAAYVKKLLQQIGFDSIDEYRAPDRTAPCGYRPNLIARLRGRNHSKTIWIISHLDVVPTGPKNLWKTDPYKMVQKDGKIYGRGVEDNQQAIVTSIYAVKAMKDLKLVPEYDVGLAFLADEETGSDYGIRYLLKNENLFSRDDIIIIPDSGSSDSRKIEIAEKSILWLKITTQGKQCHASMPHKGINAHRAGAHLLCHLDKILHQRFKRKDKIFNPPISTFEPTKKEANVENVNTIPGDDVFYIDCRVMPQYDLTAVKKIIKQESTHLEKKFGVKFTFTVQTEASAPATPASAPAVNMLKQAIHYVTNRKPILVGIGGGTFAAHFRKAGYSAVVWSTLEESCHQPNEYCVIKNMLTDTRVFAYLFSGRV
ncbi:MAG: M20 family metallo-hydrolase [Planctomycetota bacterium]